ncbi:response regulator [Ponticaulis sp.]|uniref:response regulator n=1 Tax=Ponticaulis sp. TaxID=2020902 RepID=UPI000B69DF3B|nr:response regulator [Ponticaulis sp.]MAI89131.1 hypothetical protein [Ponticaulis sp.]OUY01130.1 MAG: hypothetical protein CBB65_01435 [Hyphomonadaceae bacterium TMED5]|tara:strand:+ start:139461 stop:140309 length:849 start_codon:yes stop_codon:yes gene_type:complete
MSAQQDQMYEIVSRFCTNYESEIQALEKLMDDAERDAAGAFSTLADLHVETHRLGGAAHCMGFRFLGGEIEDVDKLIQRYLDMPNLDDTNCLTDVRKRIESLKAYRGDLHPSGSKLLNRATALEVLREGEADTEAMKVRDASRIRLLNRERILFVDDDPYIRALVARTFEDSGIEQIETARNCEDAIKALKEYQPTLIITDWEMSPVNGLELCQVIRNGRTPIPRDTPILLFSAHKTRDDRRKALKAGANKLLGKPVLPEVLIDAVAETVAKRFKLSRRARN